MLQRSIVGNRIPHALLLTGPRGIGKAAIAIAFAKTVNCSNPIVTDTTYDACDVCPSCIRAAKLHHSNIQIVTATPAVKAGTAEEPASTVSEELLEVYESLAADPYVPTRIEQATQIRIGQIRTLKKSLALSAAEEGRRVVIILDAEDMTAEASNAFLKTLEEPHDNVSLLLCTSHRERLLPTIMSRCQELTCSPISDQLIARSLVEKGMCTEAEAVLIASFSEGSMSVAYSFVSEDMAQLREQAVDLLRQSLKGRGYRSAIVDSVQKNCDAKNRKGAVTMLSLMALWLRDAAVISASNETPNIVNGDQLEPLKKFVAAFPNANYSACVKALEQSATDIYRNVSVHLVFITALLRIRDSVITPNRIRQYS